MNTTEQELVEKALETLKNAARIEGKWHPATDKGLDGIIDLRFEGQKVKRYYIEVKRELRNHDLPKLMNQRNQWPNFMVIAENIFPKIKEELRNANIAYLETNGNMYLWQPPNHQIWIDTNKIETPNKRPAKGLTKTGLKIVFLILTQETFINRTYRQIAQTAGVALGVVNQTFQTLKNLRLIVPKTKDQYILTEKKTLLDKWLVGYEEKLKPTLHIGNFTFIDRNDFLNWKTMPLDLATTTWGGEPAADLLTNYLNPEILTLYTTEAIGNLTKKYRLVPDKLGKLKIYRRFWMTTEATTNTVPVLLVYTDLVNAGNPRCAEAAEKIYDEYLRHQFQ